MSVDYEYDIILVCWGILARVTGLLQYHFRRFSAKSYVFVDINFWRGVWSLTPTINDDYTVFQCLYISLQLLPVGEYHSCYVGQLKENTSKNRYKKIFPCRFYNMHASFSFLFVYSNPRILLMDDRYDHCCWKAL